MKDWKGFALILLGLLTGGGAAGAVGAVRLANARAELHAEIREVELDGETTYDAVQLLAIAMARVEEQLKAANAKLDNLAR